MFLSTAFHSSLRFLISLHLDFCLRLRCFQYRRLTFWSRLDYLLPFFHCVSMDLHVLDFGSAFYVDCSPHALFYRCLQALIYPTAHSKPNLKLLITYEHIDYSTPQPPSYEKVKHIQRYVKSNCHLQLVHLCFLMTLLAHLAAPVALLALCCSLWWVRADVEKTWRKTYNLILFNL